MQRPQAVRTKEIGKIGVHGIIHNRGISPIAFANILGRIEVAPQAVTDDLTLPGIAAGALKERLTKGRDKARFGAAAFIVWGELPPDTGHLLETALPQAVEQLAPRRVQAIEDQLDEREQEEWALWLERHPPRQGGTVARLLRREGR